MQQKWRFNKLCFDKLVSPENCVIFRDDRNIGFQHDYDDETHKKKYDNGNECRPRIMIITIT